MKLSGFITTLLATGLCLFFACGLISCRSASKKDVPRLIEQLQDKDAGARNQAALALASLGKAAEPALATLARVLEKDTNRGVRTGAAYALRSIGTPEALAALERYKKTHPPGQ